MMNNLYKKVSVIFTSLLFLWAGNLFGQGEANNWVLPNGIRLDLANTPPTFTYLSNVNISPQSNLESSTSISDASGTQLFYSAHNTLWNGFTNAVVKTDLKTTDNSSQGHLVIPKPGSTTEYFLFTVDAHNAAVGNQGSNRGSTVYTVTVNKATQTVTCDAGTQLAGSQFCIEGQAACPSSVNGEFWYIIHESPTSGSSNPNFRVYKVTSTGVTYSHTTNVGTGAPNFPSNGYLNIKFNPCYDKVAVASSGTVALYSFNYTNGQMTYTDQRTLVEPYGLEFSASSAFLYVSSGAQGESSTNSGSDALVRLPISGTTFGTTQVIYSDISTAFNALSLASKDDKDYTGHLQMGPDGIIYLANKQSNNQAWDVTKPQYIGAILTPEKTAALVPGTDVKLNYVSITGANAQVGMALPTFLKSLVSSKPLLKVGGIESAQKSVCKGESLDLEIEVNGVTQNGINWSVDGTSQPNGSKINYVFDKVGTIPVSFTVTDACLRAQTVTSSVLVYDYISSSATQSCGTGSPVLTGSGNTISGGSYRWYDKDPTNGGKLLTIGNTYSPATGVTSVWVEPASSYTSTSVNGDARTPWDNSATTGTQTITIANSTAYAQINSFILNAANNFTGPGINSTITIKLLNSSSVQVGTDATAPIVIPPGSGQGTTPVTFNPSGWILLPGTYTLQITMPAGMYTSRNVVNTYTEGAVSITSDRTRQFKISTYTESISAPCVNGSLVNVSLCCTPPTLTTQPVAQSICWNGTTASFSAVGTSVQSWKWKQKASGATTWTDVSGASGNNATIGALNLTSLTSANSGTRYRVVATSTTNCNVFSDSVALTVRTKPNISLTALKNPVCLGESVTLTAATTSSGVGMTFGFSPTATSGTAFTPSTAANTLYTVTGTTNVANGSCVVTDTLTVKVRTLPTKLTVTSPQSVCQGQTFTMTSPTAGAGNSLQWFTSPFTIGSPSTTVPTIATTSAGDQRVFVRQVTGGTLVCASDTATIKITVNQSPQAPVGDPLNYCEGQTPSDINTLLTANNTAVKWYADNTTITTLVTPLVPSLAITSGTSATKSYYASQTVGGCESARLKFDVTVYAKPSVTLPSAQAVCSGTAYSLTSLTTTPATGVTIGWSRPTSLPTGVIAAGAASGTALPINETYTSTAVIAQSLDYTLTPSITPVTNLTCTGTQVTMPLSIKPKPSLSGTNVSPNVCKDDIFSLDLVSNLNVAGGVSGVAQNAFTWTLVPNANITGLPASSSAAVGVAAEKYTLTSGTTKIGLTGSTQQSATYKVNLSTNGCTADELTVTVKVDPCDVKVDFTANKTGECLPATGGSNLTVTNTSTAGSGSTITNYKWTFTGGTTSGKVSGVQQTGAPDNNPFVINYATAGSYDVILDLTDDKGKPYTLKKTFVVSAVPTINETGTTEYCSGSNIDITLASSNEPSATFAWTAPTGANQSGGAAGNGTKITDRLNNTSNPKAVANATYKVTVTGPAPSSCTNTKDIVITVYPNPDITVATSKAICDGASLNETLSSDISTAKVAWISTATGVTGNQGTMASPIVKNSGEKLDETLALSNAATAGTVAYSISTYTTPSTTIPALACTSSVKTFTVTVNPIPVLNALSKSSVCSGNSLNENLTSTPAGATITWTGSSFTTAPSNVSGVSANGTNTITDNLSVVGTVTGTARYVVTTTANSCSKTQNVDITVGPRPTLTVTASSASPLNICSSTSPSINITSNIATKLSWTAAVTGTTPDAMIKGPSTYTGTSNETSKTISDILKGPYLAKGYDKLVTYTITAGDVGCSDTKTFAVKVDSCPVSANFTADQTTLCDGPGLSVTYTDNSSSNANDWAWTFTNGTPATATGKGPHVVTYAQGTIGAQSVTLKVKDTGAGTEDTKTQSLVTINAVPAVTNTAIEKAFSICSGSKTGIQLKSDQASASYTWTTTGASQGATAQAAPGVTAPNAQIDQTLTNTTGANVDVVYSVTPSITANSKTCTGTAVDFTVTVKPLPTVTLVSNSPICSGSKATVAATVSLGGTATWNRPKDNSIIEGTATNTGNVDETLTAVSSTLAGTAKYVFTPTANGCTGKKDSVNITVNPAPSMPNATDALCSGSTLTATVTSTIPGSIITWNRAADADVNNNAAGTNTFTSGGSFSESLTLGNTVTTAKTVVYKLVAKGPGASACTGPEATITVTVNPIPKITSKLTDSVCSGSAYNKAFTATGGNLTYAWTQLNGGNRTLGQTVTVSKLENISTNPIIENFKLEAISATTPACSTTANLAVTVQSAPTVTWSLVKSSICLGKETDLKVSLSGGVPPYDLVYGTGNTQANGLTQGDNIIKLKPSSTTNYNMASLTDKIGCSAAVPSALTLTVNGNPKINLIRQNQNLCEGTSDEATLNFSITSGAATATTFTYWFAEMDTITGDSLPYGGYTASGTNGASPTFIVQPTSTKTYKATKVLDNNGCEATGTGTLTVKVNPKPVAKVVSITEDTLCNGSNLVMKLTSTAANTNGTVFSWSAGTTPNVKGVTLASDPNALTDQIVQTAITNTSTTNQMGKIQYTIVPILNGCKGDALVQNVLVKPSVKISLGADRADVCPSNGGSVQTFKDANNNSPLEWTRNGIDIMPETGSTANAIITEDDEIIATFNDDCGSISDTVKVKVRPIETLTMTTGDSCAAYTVTLEPGTVKPIKNKTSIENWAWSFSDNLSTYLNPKVSDNQKPSVTYIFQQPNVAPDNYTITLKGYIAGCEVANQEFPIVMYNCELNRTNMITPNGDGANEKWMIEGIEYFPDASLTVFNRWGQVIHQVNSNINASNAWDGKNDNGEEVEDGVYYYIITLSRAKRVLKGYITVVRDTGRQ